MNVWKLVEPRKLVKTEAPLPEAGEGLVRIRVTKVYLNNQDAALFTGAIRVRYPLIPGRYAVGFVAEEGNPLYPKGTRVLLHTYRPIPKDGTEKRDFTADEYYACGKTTDGFLSDFILVSPRDFTPLPASVNDERGLFLHHLAAARRIVDNLGVQKGRHYAVIGADYMGILVCQLLIYLQAAPILVDKDKRRLDFAKSCGVYYTFLADDNLVDNVVSVTGGRLASGAVYIATASGNGTDLPFVLAAHGATAVFFAKSTDPVSVNLETAIRKHITVQCVSHGVKYLETAINLMANKAVDPTMFVANTVRADNVAALLESYSDKPDRDVNGINVVNLLL